LGNLRLRKVRADVQSSALPSSRKICNDILKHYSGHSRSPPQHATDVHKRSSEIGIYSISGVGRFKGSDICVHELLAHGAEAFRRLPKNLPPVKEIAAKTRISIQRGISCDRKNRNLAICRKSSVSSALQSAELLLFSLYQLHSPLRENTDKSGRTCKKLWIRINMLKHCAYISSTWRE
jgi:hypothetical protein